MQDVSCHDRAQKGRGEQLALIELPPSCPADRESRLDEWTRCLGRSGVASARAALARAAERAAAGSAAA